MDCCCFIKRTQGFVHEEAMVVTSDPQSGSEIELDLVSISSKNSFHSVTHGSPGHPGTMLKRKDGGTERSQTTPVPTSEQSQNNVSVASFPPTPILQRRATKYWPTIDIKDQEVQTPVDLGNQTDSCHQATPISNRRSTEYLATVDEVVPAEHEALANPIDETTDNIYGIKGIIIL